MTQDTKSELIILDDNWNHELREKTIAWMAERLGDGNDASTILATMIRKNIALIAAMVDTHCPADRSKAYEIVETLILSELDDARRRK